MLTSGEGEFDVDKESNDWWVVWKCRQTCNRLYFEAAVRITAQDWITKYNKRTIGEQDNKIIREHDNKKTRQ